MKIAQTAELTKIIHAVEMYDRQAFPMSIRDEIINFELNAPGSKDNTQAWQQKHVLAIHFKAPESQDSQILR